MKKKYATLSWLTSIRNSDEFAFFSCKFFTFIVINHHKMSATNFLHIRISALAYHPNQCEPDSAKHLSPSRSLLLQILSCEYRAALPSNVWPLLSNWDDLTILGMNFIWQHSKAHTGAYITQGCIVISHCLHNFLHSLFIYVSKEEYAFNTENF